jgi:Nitrogen regulatory protein PII
MIKVVVRPERAADVLSALCDAGFRAVTKLSILGRGKQQGLKVGSISYDEIPKEMMMMVVEDKDESRVIKIITEAARTSKEGTYGDGKIFVLPVSRCVTISSGAEEL